MRGDLIRAIRGPSGGLLASVLVAAVFGGAAIAAPRSPFQVSNRPAIVRTPDGQSTDRTAVVAPSVGRSGQESDGGTVRRDTEVVSHPRVDGHGRRAPQGQGAGQGHEHSSHAHATRAGPTHPTHPDSPEQATGASGAHAQNPRNT